MSVVPAELTASLLKHLIQNRAASEGLRPPSSVTAYSTIVVLYISIRTKVVVLLLFYEISDVSDVDCLVQTLTFSLYCVHTVVFNSEPWYVSVVRGAAV